MFVSPGHRVRLHFVSGAAREGRCLIASVCHVQVGPGQLGLLDSAHGSEVDLSELLLAGVLNQVDLILQLHVARL